jgi:hypothetical protein
LVGHIFLQKMLDGNLVIGRLGIGDWVLVIGRLGTGDW